MSSDIDWPAFRVVGLGCWVLGGGLLLLGLGLPPQGLKKYFDTTLARHIRLVWPGLSLLTDQSREVMMEVDCTTEPSLYMQHGMFHNEA